MMLLLLFQGVIFPYILHKHIYENAFRKKMVFDLFTVYKYYPCFAAGWLVRWVTCTHQSVLL